MLRGADPALCGRYLLAVDTTSESGSIALAQTAPFGHGSGTASEPRPEGAVGGLLAIEEVALDAPAEGYAHILFDEIARLLARHRLGLADIDCFASAAGPGSFTGVRVGLTAVMGLAEANQRNVVTVSNLQALAFFGSRHLRATVLDARRGEIYGAVYDASLGIVQKEAVRLFEAWIAALPESDIEIVTNGFALPAQPHPVIYAPRTLAGAIAQIAARRFSEGLAVDPSQIDANYVRRSDAELHWRDPRGVNS
jgi:tRNA threonylcarbamoyladenosine biosynthesis protein TsaB